MSCDVTVVEMISLDVMVTMTMMMMMVGLLPDVWTLPALGGVSMESVDMRHLLKWRPLQAACNTTVLYSVQFQGEFELTVLNGRWIDAHDCQLTPDASCDLTFDLGSDSDYNLRVRAKCGSQMSVWTETSSPFNRRDTVLTALQMDVVAVDDGLQVSFRNLPVTAVVMVTVRKRGDELQPTVFTLPADQTMLHVAALQEGGVYCIRAQMVLGTHSSSTDTQCVSITRSASDAEWKTVTTVVLTVVVMTTLLVVVFRSVTRCRPDDCRQYFHKETPPQSLQSDWDIKMTTISEEAEPLEVVSVLSAATRKP